jgi:hypothetical protein
MIIVYVLGLVLALFTGAGLTVWALPVVLVAASPKAGGRHGQPSAASWLPPTEPPAAEQNPYVFDGAEPRYRRPYVDEPTGDIYGRFAASAPGVPLYQDITSEDGAR